MEWIETIITTKSEAVEAISGALMEIGITGIIIEDDQELQSFLNMPMKYWDYIDESLENRNSEEAYIKFYLTDNSYGKKDLENVKQSIENLKTMDIGLNLGSLEITTNNVDDEDWINNWKNHYKTFEVGEKIAIKPVWEKYENKDNKVVFNIEPGHAFGTGLHQSTQLCLIALEKYIDNTKEVLDLGTGTGILAIVSMLLGAKNALAIDIDPNAANTAIKNFGINNIKDNFNVLPGDILVDDVLREQIKVKKYNVIVANIVADVIIDFLDFVKEVLTDDGIFICSGIITERADDVSNALVNKNFVIINKSERDGWISISASIKQEHA